MLQTLFTLSATKFQDEDLPLRFRYLIDANKEPLFRYSTSNVRTTGLPLPSSHPASNALLITVQVQDRYGASSHAATTVNVRLPEASTNDSSLVTNIVANATQELKALAIHGDPSTVLANMRSITSLINSGGGGTNNDATTSGTTTNNTGNPGNGGNDGNGGTTGSTTGSTATYSLSKEETTKRANARQELFQVLEEEFLSL